MKRNWMILPMKVNPGNPFFHIKFFPESVSVPGRISIADAHRGGRKRCLKKEARASFLLIRPRSALMKNKLY
jgi:hypothetical protein